MKKNNRGWRFLYKLHRYIGLFSAIILLMLAITGIALNHTKDLKLDSQMIQSPLILDWYEIKVSNNLSSFSTGQHWLILINQQLYFDQTLLLKNQQHLFGAVETNEFIVVALNDSLLLLSLEGELIEQSPFNNIKKIGLDNQQQIVIKSDDKIVSSNDGLLSWQVHSSDQVAWSKNALPLPSTLKEIKQKFRSSILPLERVFLDIHSGRFFGFIGVLLVDLSGICLIILAFSGCSIWLKHKLRVLNHR